ncbi:MAG TPA: hypothetical protein VMV57_03535 [Terracidiphilus sp.]|nr:hypothetical protein [Terracidiphilus sp.]
MSQGILGLLFGKTWVILSWHKDSLAGSSMEDSVMNLVDRFVFLVVSLIRQEEAQDLVEYGLVVALVAFGAVAGLKELGSTAGVLYSAISSVLGSAI